MNRIYKLTIFVLLGFIPFSGLRNEVSTDHESVNSEVKTQNNPFPTLDFKRIEQKCLSYKRLSQRSKNFRTAVYAGVALGTLVYAGVKFFGRGDKENMAVNSNGTSVAGKSEPKTEDKLFRNLGFWDRCWCGCKQGVSNGFYYGASAVVVTALLSFQSAIWASSKNKFFELWKGQHQEHMLKTIKLLQINFKQIKNLFDFTLNELDTDEVKNNYALFIDFSENLIALVTQLAQDELQKDSTAQASILNLKDLLITRILAFSEVLERFLKEAADEKDKKEINVDKTDPIKLSFEKLGDQLIRFINLSYSTIYEA